MFGYLAVAINGVGVGQAIRLIPPWNWDTCKVDTGSIFDLICILNDWFPHPQSSEARFFHVISFFALPLPWRVSSGCTPILT